MTTKNFKTTTSGTPKVKNYRIQTLIGSESFAGFRTSQHSIRCHPKTKRDEVMNITCDNPPSRWTMLKHMGKKACFLGLVVTMKSMNEMFYHYIESGLL